MKVIVPYDSRTGHVYLNSLGKTEDEARVAFDKGFFDLNDNDLECIKFVTGELSVGGQDDNPSLFPVVVPYAKTDNTPLIRCAGSNRDEAGINLESESLDPADYLFESGVITIDLALDHDAPPSLLKL